MEIKQITVKCDFCNCLGNMVLDWNEFLLPKNWRYRTRSFRDDYKPEQIQIQCGECAKCN